MIVCIVRKISRISASKEKSNSLSVSTHETRISIRKSVKQVLFDVLTESKQGLLSC